MQSKITGFQAHDTEDTSMDLLLDAHILYLPSSMHRRFVSRPYILTAESIHMTQFYRVYFTFGVT